jgi:quercetin dioxygenase-like cupin family protein
MNSSTEESMKFLKVIKDVKQPIERYDSKFAFYSRIARSAKSTSIGYMCIEPNGIVGLHEAPIPQLFLVVQGEGWVRVQNGSKVLVKMGEGVFFDRGELHESGTETGMISIILQSDKFLLEFMESNEREINL